MKKYVYLLLSVLMVLGLCACSQKKEVTDTPRGIEKKLIEAIGANNYLCDKEMDEDSFYQFYGLDKEQIDSYVAKESSDKATNPDRVVILKVKEGYDKDAVKALNETYASIVNEVRTSKNGIGKSLNAVIYSQDHYVAFILAGSKYDGDNSEKEIQVAKKDYETFSNEWKEIFGTSPNNLAIVPPAKAK